MEHRVDEIRSAFKRSRLQSLFLQKIQQSAGDQRLAAAAGRRRDHDPADSDLLIIIQICFCNFRTYLIIIHMYCIIFYMCRIVSHMYRILFHMNRIFSSEPCFFK